MTNQMDELSGTADYERDGSNGEQNENNTNGEDDDYYATKYERFRDDQINTGVVSALVGGFALTNSWEMDVAQREDRNDYGLLDILCYSLAIISVHLCTCSAIVSAFLYRALTRQTTCRKGVEFIERHEFLAQIPWHKFVWGTLSYVSSVILVSWTVLEISFAAKIITLVFGLMGFISVVCTAYVIGNDRVQSSNETNSNRKVSN